MAFRPDGGLLATAGGMGDHPAEVKLWDPGTGQELGRLEAAPAPVRGLCFRADGRQLAGAIASYDNAGRSSSGEVWVWDLETRRAVRKLHADRRGVLAVAFSPDGRWLGSADAGGGVLVWDAASGSRRAELMSVDDPEASTLTSVAFSPDSRLLAVGGHDRSIRVWDVASWASGIGRSRPQALFTLQHPGTVYGLGFSPDGRTLSAAYGDGIVRDWDLASRTLRRSYLGHVGAVSALAYSRDGWRLASASTDATVKVWDATQDRATLPLRANRTQSRETLAIAFAPDARWLATAMADRTVRVWDPDTQLVRHACRGHADMIHALASSADGRWLASGGDDRIISLWDPDTGRRLRTIGGFARPITGLAFSPDGRWLACSMAQWREKGGVELIGLAADGPRIALSDPGDSAHLPGCLPRCLQP